jgi:hypothetical protein
LDIWAFSTSLMFAHHCALFLMSQARCLQELYVNSNSQFHSRSNYDSTPLKALQTIISLRTVWCTIHTDLVKAYLTSCIVCAPLTRSLGSDVVNDFIVHLRVLVINKNVKWSADEMAETFPPQFLRTRSM